MDWDDELEGDFAEHMFVDPKTLVATLTTNKGNTQLWDLREGFILATNDTKIKFQACAPLNWRGLHLSSRELDGHYVRHVRSGEVGVRCVLSSLQ